MSSRISGFSSRKLARVFGVVALVAGCLVVRSPAEGAMLTYTLNSGSSTIDGSLNGVPFSSATYVITATGDSAAVQSGLWGGALPMYTLQVSPTLSLFSSGTQFASVALLPTSGMQWMVGSLDMSLLVGPGVGLNVFALDPNQIVGSISGFGVYVDNSFNNLQSVATYAPGGAGASLSADVGAPYNTSEGPLVISAASNLAPFGAFYITADSVPEIDPAGMGSVLALVTGGLALIERRRLKVA